MELARGARHFPIMVQKSNPFSLAMDSWQLGLEAWTVIGLRIPRLLTGNPAAVLEAQRMIVEKIEAVSILQWRAMTGDLGMNSVSAMRNSIAHYRKAVGRNRRRLSRKK
jgi:hypothetical protein